MTLDGGVLGFVAGAVYSGEGLDFDGHLVVLGEFADGNGKRVELSLAAEFDEQDRKLAMDQHCLSLHSGATSYGAVERAALVGDTLRLEIGQRAAEALGVAWVEVVVRQEDAQAVLDGLASVGVPVLREPVGDAAKTGDVQAVRDLEQAHPVATAWRPTFELIVAKFAAGDLADVASLDLVSVEAAVLRQAEEYLADYGETLVPLPSAAWETSVAQWMDGHWDVVVDLWTAEAGASDLVLAATVRVDGEGRQKVRLDGVYVP